jgi:hypothetical protein
MIIKEDNLFLYIIIYGVTIIFLKFLTAIFLVTRTYMVSRTHTYNTIDISEYQIQPPFGIFFTKKSPILQILQLAIYQLICNIV